MRREEHSVKAELHRSGEWVDAMTYALLREEWLLPRLTVRSSTSDDETCQASTN